MSSWPKKANDRVGTHFRWIIYKRRFLQIQGHPQVFHHQRSENTTWKVIWGHLWPMSDLLGHRGDWEWSSRDHFGPRKRFWIKTANVRSNLWINFRKQMVILSEQVNTLKILRWNFNTVLRLGELVRYDLTRIGFWDNNRLADSLDAGVSPIWPMNAFKFKLSLLLIKSFRGRFCGC